MIIMEKNFGHIKMVLLKIFFRYILNIILNKLLFLLLILITFSLI